FQTDPNAAVLWSPSFRDIQFRQQLHARDDRRLQPTWWAGKIREDAINPEPDAKPLTGRLEVDVARRGFMGLTDEEIHEPDDRWLVGETTNVRRLGLPGVATGFQFGAEVLHQLEDRLTGAEHAAYSVVQGNFVDMHKLDVCLVRVPQVLDRVRIRDSGHRHPKASVTERQGEHAVVGQVLLAETLGYRQEAGQ